LITPTFQKERILSKWHIRSSTCASYICIAYKTTIQWNLPEGVFSASTQAGTQLWLLVLHIQPPKRASKKRAEEQVRKTLARSSNWKQKR